MKLILTCPGSPSIAQLSISPSCPGWKGQEGVHTVVPLCSGWVFSVDSLLSFAYKRDCSVWTPVLCIQDKRDCSVWTPSCPFSPGQEGLFSVDSLRRDCTLQCPSHTEQSLLSRMVRTAIHRGVRYYFPLGTRWTGGTVPSYGVPPVHPVPWRQQCVIVHPIPPSQWTGGTVPSCPLEITVCHCPSQG